MTTTAGSSTVDRTGDLLNRALHLLLTEDPDAFVLGEDVEDPYGGAFKVTRGLSTAFPGRVRSTPISESAIVGAGTGLAMAGRTAVVELMFGDFLTLAFDQILHAAAVADGMYGAGWPLRLVVRTPVGGRRGYGPTHSQSLQKHFVGVPGLVVAELSPAHPPDALLRHLLRTGRPALLVEDKTLYTERSWTEGEIDDVFSLRLVGPAPGIGLLSARAGTPDCVIVCGGSTAHRSLAAARRLLLDEDILCDVLVVAQVHPLDTATVAELIPLHGRVVVVEESTAGGTWGAEVAHELHSRLWGRLARPVALCHSDARVIPAARHLEDEVLVDESRIVRAVQGVLDA